MDDNAQSDILTLHQRHVIFLSMQQHTHVDLMASVTAKYAWPKGKLLHTGKEKVLSTI